MNFKTLLKPAFALACLLMAQSAFAGHFLYTGGHPIDPSRMGMLGFSFDEFSPSDAGWATALSGGDGRFDAIVVGEAQGSYSISNTTAANIRAYISNGGKLVVINDHNANIVFTNQLTGYGLVVGYGCQSGEDVGGTLQASAANGTAFQSGSATLHNLSCTAAIQRSSLPVGAKSIYSGVGTTLAFTTRSGRGQFAWLGWDYCCGQRANENDWYHVLATAASPSFKVCAGAGYTGAKMVLCQQICEVHQSSKNLAALNKAFNVIYHTAPSCAVELPLDGGGFPF